MVVFFLFFFFRREIEKSGNFCEIIGGGRDYLLCEICAKGNLIRKNWKYNLIFCVLPTSVKNLFKIKRVSLLISAIFLVPVSRKGFSFSDKGIFHFFAKLNETRA